MSCRRCIKCPADAAPGRVRCDACLEKAREYQAAKKDRRECAGCSRPAVPGRTYCRRHLDRMRRYTARWRVHGATGERTPAGTLD